MYHWEIDFTYSKVIDYKEIIIIIKKREVFMSELKTEYAGLELKNPLIVSSSGLTAKLEKIKKCEKAGAGAVVLKSLFEEQIIKETKEMIDEIWLPDHTEAIEYARGMSMATGPDSYLQLIKEAKKETDLPIIASLNCISPRWWTDYAGQIEIAGADGLELNVSILPSDPLRGGEEVEEIYYEITEKVLNNIDIPVFLKVGPYFSSLGNVIRKLSGMGVSGFVLFNRFYQIDFDVEKMEITSGNPLSSPEEMNDSLRWIALLSGRIDSDFSATTGIHTGEDMIKQLLAGAKTVQVCSTLYLNGIKYIGEMLGKLDTWMKEKGFKNIDEFRGELSYDESGEPELIERMQYISALNESY